MSSKLGHEVRKLVGKNYGKGSKTTEKLLSNLKVIAAFMESEGLQSIRHMKTKHVNRFFDSLKAKGRVASTLGNYATAMRVIAHAIGKDNIVPSSNCDLGVVRKDRYQPKQGDIAKMESIRQALYQKNAWQGLASDMAMLFGLRQKESLLSHQIVTRHGKDYLKVEGTKGNRPRDVEIVSNEQRELLKQVHEQIRISGGTSLIPPNLNLVQALIKQKNDMHRAGGTKANKANGHLWRHMKAQDLVRDGKSDKEIAEYLGHNREGSAKHYKK